MRRRVRSLLSRLSPLVVGSVLLGAVLAGCSGSGESGPPVVDRAVLEQEISTRLGDQVGRPPQDVSCPGDLTGAVEEQMRCTVTDTGTDVGVTVTVTAVEGTDVRFTLETDDAPVG